MMHSQQADDEYIIRKYHAPPSFLILSSILSIERRCLFDMEILSDKRCIIGEGPIWHDRDKLLYFTNGMEKEFCRLDLQTGA